MAEPQLLLPDWNTGTYREGQDITEQLGVIKFEPPPIFSNAGNLVPLPPLVSVYDIEGAERFGSLVERLLDEPVMITEKLEGSHFAASIDETGTIAVSQRRYKIEPIDSAEHDWHKAARLSGLRDKLPALKADIEQRRGASVATVTVRGELIGPGVQGNYYKLPQQTIRVFEIEVNGEALAAHDFLALIEKFQIETVPVLVMNVTLRAWLNGRSIVDASNGASVLNPVLAREGIVVRPMTEMRDDTIGRLIIKQRSPDYLAISEY